MTSPLLSAVAGGPVDSGQGDQETAVDRLSRIVSGSPTLVTHPHLVTALLNSNATPEQAQSIGMFVTGLQAQQRVQAAQSTGAKITLSPFEKAGLDQFGVDYSKVEFTAADQSAAIAKQLAKLTATKTTSSGGGGGWSFGRVLHDVTHNPIVDTIAKAGNFVGSEVASGLEGAAHGIENLGGPNLPNGDGLVSSGQTRGQIIANANAQATQASGYDPTNPFSLLAYAASGKQTLDISSLYENNDPALVDQAVKFSDDPEGYIKNITEPTSGLAPAEVASKLQEINGKQFQNLVTQVSARRATPGSLLTEGIDPEKHPNLQRYTAAGIDLAFSFVADPTLAALGAAKVVKASQLALDTGSVAGDAAKVRNILNGTTKGLYASQLRRGTQSLIDSTGMIRKGVNEGDDALTAAGYAKLRAETPGLEHLASDFTGGTRAIGFDGDMTTGALKFGRAEPITTMDEAADYLSSTAGLVRLRAGRPLAEASYMPGQLSAFGFRKIRGALAAATAARGVGRDAKLIDLSKAGVAGRILPAEDDAVDAVTGAPLAEPAAAEGVPSAVRASAAYGDALQAARTGVGPGAIAARGRLLAQRFTHFLPRNTTFATDDPNAVQNVFRYGSMYLTHGRANLLAGAYAAGDEGAKKAILNGLELQTMHAAGLGKTTAGRALIDEASTALNGERYASTGDLDRIIDPATGNERAAAIWDTQVNPKVTLTGFRDLQKVGAKIGLWESTVGRGMNSQLVDNLMGVIKPGWLISGTNIVRNSGEDLVGAFARGELGDVTAAKAVAEENGLLPARTRLGSLVAAPLARVAQRYRMLRIATSDDNLGLKYIAELDPEVTHTIADNWTRFHAASMIDPGGMRAADEITKAGFIPRAVKTVRTGFSETGVDEDMVGADRLATALARVVNGNADHANVVIDHLTDPETTPVESIARNLAAPANAKRVNQMMRAGMFQDDSGQWIRAVTPADKELALRQLASAQAQDLRYLLQGRNGALNQGLVDYIRANGKAPEAKWVMDNLTGEQRPLTVLAPQFESTPTEKGITGFVGAISDLAGKGYQHIVERSIARLSSMPVFLSHYGKARATLAPIEQAMVDGGLSVEAAAHNATQLAMDMAWNRTMKYIDDPTLRTQMDVVGRNFFAFSRATQAFIRRWGTQFVEDPSRLRRIMLGMEGAQHAGVTYTDENGQKQFVFPGSGFAIEALQHLESLIPGVNVLSVPGITPDLTGKVALLQPGLQNPLQFSLTPIINIPMRTIFNLFPEHRHALDEVDSFLNGQNGQGQSPLSEIMPTAIKKFTDALNTDDRDSMMASSTRQAILNLAAAGKLPPAGADAAQIDGFLQNLKTQVKNQLIHRAIFGFFTPAPPGQPTESTDGSQADWFYGATGVKGLDGEWKKLLNDSGGDYARASAIWTKLHPDKLFYTTGTTQLTTRSSTLNATAASESWLESHLDFMSKYKGVSAYFIPPAVQGGNFDIEAYHSQLELGLRQHKDLKSYYTDVRIANASSDYYAALNTRDAAIQADPGNAKGYKASFDTWAKEFKSLNPLFASATGDYAGQVLTAQNALSTLRRLVTDNPSGVQGVGEAGLMVDAYDKFHNALAAHPGSSNYAKAIHKSLASSYSDWMHAAVAENPQFKGLYQGVFRVLDSKTLDSLEGN